MLFVGDIANGEMPCRIDIDFDILCANLEGPLGNLSGSQKSLKAGPHLCNSAKFLSRSKEYVFSLANNHFWDYGLLGYEATLRELANYKYHAGGAGRDIQQARQPLLLDYEGKRLAFIFSCERQFGLAGDTSGGCAHEGPWIFPLIKHLHEEADHIIVSCHRALEMSSVPTHDTRELYRAYIDCGASLVWGHHSHVPQIFEKYNSGFIAYGLGNFIVQPKKWLNCQNTLWSIGLEASFKNGFEIFPRYFVISMSDGIISVCESVNSEMKQYLDKYQNIFHNPKEYKRMCLSNAKACYAEYCQDYIWCDDAICKQLSKRGWRDISSIIKRVVSCKLKNERPRGSLLPYHIISCESHREAFLTYEQSILSIDK